MFMFVLETHTVFTLCVLHPWLKLMKDLWAANKFHSPLFQKLFPHLLSRIWSYKKKFHHDHRVSKRIFSHLISCHSVFAYWIAPHSSAHITTVQSLNKWQRLKLSETSEDTNAHAGICGVRCNGTPSTFYAVLFQKSNPYIKLHKLET
jgi:hypothetical protein